MNILLVTAFYPPLNRIASSRPYSWANHAAQNGHNVTVYTYKKGVAHGPLNLVEDSDLSYLIEYKGLAGRYIDRVDSNIIGKVARRAQRYLWAVLAWNIIRKEKTKYDVVISTYGPMQCHLIGWVVKKAGLATKWLVDYRDLWTGNLMTPRESKWQRVEQYLLGGCDHVVTVSDPLKQHLEKLSSGDVPVDVIYNGYTGGIRSPVVPETNSAKLRLVHAGTIYPGWRDPTGLFRAVSNLRAKGLLSPENCVLVFLGDRIPGVVDAAKTLEIADMLETPGQVSRQESLRIQNQASALILLMSADAQNNGTLTGKIFEYLAAGRPILGLGFGQGSAAGQLIETAQAGMALGEDEKQIEEAILSVKRGSVQPWFSPNTNVIETYSRDSQAQRLLNIVENMAS